MILHRLLPFLVAMLLALSPGSGEAPATDGLEELVAAGRYAEAIELGRTLASEPQPTTDRARALDLLVEALLEQGKGHHTETVTLAERAVALPHEVNPHSRLDRLTAVRQLARIRRERRELETAHHLVAEALAGVDSRPPSLETAELLAELALIEIARAEYAAAEAAYERALSSAEQCCSTAGREAVRISRMWRDFATLLVWLDQPERARELAERSLAVQRRELRPGHPEIGRSLLVLGQIDHLREPLEEAAAVLEDALGAVHPALGSTYFQLGEVLYDLGEYGAAERSYRRAIAIDEAASGREHPSVARDLKGLAYAVMIQGDLPGARALAETALEISASALGASHPQVGGILGFLGDLAQQIGDYGAARRYMERAVEILVPSVGTAHQSYAASLYNLAVVTLASGDAEAAVALAQRSLAIAEANLGPDHPDLAYDLTLLGKAAADLGDYGASRNSLERALEIRESRLEPASYLTAETRTGLARTLWMSGELTAARDQIARAARETEHSLGPTHPQVGGVLVGWATILGELGETDLALDRAFRAEAIGREHLKLAGRGLSEREMLAYAADRSRGLDLALSLTIERRADSVPAVEAVWNAAVRSRAVVLDEMAARVRAVQRSEQPEISRLRDELSDARLRLANLVVRGPEEDREFASDLETALGARERAERALAAASASFRTELARGLAGVEEVLEALPAESALVAYVLFDRHSFRQSGGAGPQPPIPSYAVLGVGARDRRPWLVDLGRAAEIDELIGRWSDAMAREALAAGRSSPRTERAYRSVGRALRERIWDPVAAHLGDAELLFIVPDGALNLVSFASLPSGEDGYLVESGPRVHYLSVERDLVLEAGASPSQGLLVVGAPSFDAAESLADSADEELEGPTLVASVSGEPAMPFRGATSGCPDFRSLRFEGLPEAEREAREVGRIWEEASRDSRSVDPGGALVLLGTAASESRFKRLAGGRRVLHVASHGFFLGGRCTSALDAGPAKDLLRGMPASGALGESPLVLAGLAFAGANHRRSAGSDQDDGVLTAEEIAALALEGTEWVVLSACETGGGHIEVGEGVLGLRRAFHVAGAKTVVMSLWSVEDRVTREWMAGLYRARLAEGLSTVEAVERASRGLLEARRAAGETTHPYYWASFVAAGDWH